MYLSICATDGEMTPAFAQMFLKFLPKTNVKKVSFMIWLL